MMGLYTDGGHDENRGCYAVDNVFVANNWRSFCSKIVPPDGIHCFGVLKASSS